MVTMTSARNLRALPLTESFFNFFHLFNNPVSLLLFLFFFFFESIILSSDLRNIFKWSGESKQLCFFFDMYIPSLRPHGVTKYKAEDKNHLTHFTCFSCLVDILVKVSQQ